MILVHIFSPLLYEVIAGLLWFTLVLVSWLCFLYTSLHTVFHVMWKKFSLLQFGGNHSLGNTYSVALVCCLEISSFKVGFNVRKLTVMLPMLMFLCHGGRCDSLYLTGDNVNVAI